MLRCFIAAYCFFALNAGFSLATKQCDSLGIYPSEDPEKFIVCTNKDGEIIRSELACSNGLVYSGTDGRCIPKSNGIFTFYNLFDTRPGGDTDLKLNCITPGTICTDCSTQAICVGETEPDGSIAVKVVTNIICPPEEHCSSGVGCIRSLTEPCSLGPFLCDDTGAFPDPYDCTKYHYCNSKFPQQDLTCTSGSFNSSTASCGYSMNSTSCLFRPVPFCKKFMQMGPLSENPTIYYICLQYNDYTLRPSLHRCPGNLQFNLATLTCI